jgi:hypothetical protein
MPTPKFEANIFQVIFGVHPSIDETVGNETA